MGIILKYIIKRFSINFLLTLFAVLLLSFLIDTIESSKTISQSNVSMGVVLSFLFNKFEVVSISAFPIIVYISLIILLFDLHIKNEYLSFLTSGLNPTSLLAILLPVVGIACLVYFFLNDRVLPAASREVDRLLVFEFKRFTASWTYFYRDRNWFLGADSTIYHYEDIDDANMQMKNFEMYVCGDDGPERILFSDNFRYIGDRTYLADNLRIYRIDGERIEYQNYPEYRMRLQDEYEIFKQRRGRPSQMSLVELMGLIKLRERIGLDTSRYRYELYTKVVNPISLILLCLLIMVVFIERLYLHSSKNILYYGAGILLLFLLIITFSQKLSESSINAPFFAAILPLFFPIIFLIYFLLNPRLRNSSHLR